MSKDVNGFMQGRNGMDELNRFLIHLGMILMLIFFLLKLKILFIFSAVITAMGFARCFSKELRRCSKQNQSFLFIRNTIYDRVCDRFSSLKENFFSGRSDANGEKKSGCGFRVFKCPSCRQKLRVPSGKGKIEIHCKKCNNYFIKRT